MTNEELKTLLLSRLEKKANMDKEAKSLLSYMQDPINMYVRKFNKTLKESAGQINPAKYIRNKIISFTKSSRFNNKLKKALDTWATDDQVARNLASRIPNTAKRLTLNSTITDQMDARLRAAAKAKSFIGMDQFFESPGVSGGVLPTYKAPGNIFELRPTKDGKVIPKFDMKAVQDLKSKDEYF